MRIECWSVGLTRLATEPLMEAIMAMLPPLPQRIISFATAWAVMNTPVDCSQYLHTVRLRTELAYQ